MRSFQEVSFRLRQEMRNAIMLARPPKLPKNSLAKFSLRDGLPHLPPASTVCDSLRGSEFENSVIQIAEQILDHRFPIFGGVLETGRDIRAGAATTLAIWRPAPPISDWFRISMFLVPAITS